MKTPTKVHLFSLKKHVFSLFVLFALTACSFAQKPQIPNTENQPKVNINVNKQFDENGNIVRYDSTYSWSWSNMEENFSDSVFSQIFPKSNFLWNNHLSEFDIDSLFFYRFSLPLFNDSFLNFDIDREMKDFFNKQQRWIQEQQEIIHKFMQPQTPLPKNNKELEIKENYSPNKNDEEKQGVDL